MNSGIVCATCRACGHRAALEIGRQGDMRQLAALRLVCAACGAGRPDLSIPLNASEATAFIKGA